MIEAPSLEEVDGEVGSLHGFHEGRVVLVVARDFLWNKEAGRVGRLRLYDEVGGN